jgi:hypothetical protein
MENFAVCFLHTATKRAAKFSCFCLVVKYKICTNKNCLILQCQVAHNLRMNEWIKALNFFLLFILKWHQNATTIKHDKLSRLSTEMFYFNYGNSLYLICNRYLCTISWNCRIFGIFICKKWLLRRDMFRFS